MKKIILGFCTLSLLVSIVSCRSAATKQSANFAKSEDLREIPETPAETYAKQKPNSRAWGVGTHFQESTANNLAELNARTKLARALQSCIQSGTKNSGSNTSIFSADDNSGNMATDQSATADDREFGFAKELIRSAVVVKTNKYKTANNQYKIYVCVEYTESIPQIAGNAAKAIQNKLTPEQRTQAKFDEHRFKEELEKSMTNYQGISE